MLSFTQLSNISAHPYPMYYPHRISIAPMMDYTDRHLRYLLRLISSHTLLYTEMITSEAILQGDREHLLAYHPAEQPLVLQLGGSDPHKLAQCAQIAEDYGYAAVNLNAGCPSDRVLQGKFGACLMKEPDLVAKCLQAMRARVKIPVTLKTRIGVDELDSYSDLTRFIARVAQSGCDTFILHARKAWLHGLSPKENRTIPPLRHEVVYQLKQDFPQLTLILNGGIQTIAQIDTALQQLDGVMLGRYPCHDPYFLSEVDRLFYHDTRPKLSREEVINQMLEYMTERMQQGVRLQSMSRHLLGMFYGTKCAKQWRRYLSENAHKPGADVSVIRQGLQSINLERQGSS